jgi:dihydrofolate synthase/folylpolyglutamate synthase
MRRERIEADQAFFAERIAQRAPGRRRSLSRARALAPHLGIDLDAWRAHPERVITVVGSKGKGTAATFASAALAAAGLRVGTLTSPGLRSNRERIRVDGAAIARPDYETLVAAVARTATRVADRLPDGGYLSPSGLFTLSALRHFAERRCDAVVLEAGMGGASDEVALVAPGVVVVTSVLAEHLGTLGESVAAIAREKAGVITAATRDVLVADQDDPAAAAEIAAAAAVHGCRQHWAGLGDDPATAAARPAPATPGAVRRAPAEPSPAAAGLGARPARLGVAAALLLLDLAGRPAPPPVALAATLRSVRLPGRLSRHRRGDQEWIVDCATNPAAIAAAIAHATASIGPPTAVLTFIPRQRDRAPLLRALHGWRLVEVPGGRRTGAPGSGAVMRLEAVDLDALGPRVLALGPVYFAGEVLATLDADCERSFGLPPSAAGRLEARPG